MKKGLLIIISGPSGVGKSTIRERLIEENNNFWYSISMTTRKPRFNEKTNDLEVDGKDYYFVDIDTFKNNINNNNFLEFAEVYENIFYGTPKDIVFEKLNNGINVILEIDVDGALIVKENYKDALLIFIKPESILELEKRLLNRNSDSKEKIEERLQKAIYEIDKAKYYDHIIVSKDKEHDYIEVLNIIKEYEN